MKILQQVFYFIGNCLGSSKLFYAFVKGVSAGLKKQVDYEMYIEKEARKLLETAMELENVSPELKALLRNPFPNGMEAYEAVRQAMQNPDSQHGYQ